MAKNGNGNGLKHLEVSEVDSVFVWKNIRIKNHLRRLRENAACPPTVFVIPPNWRAFIGSFFVCLFVANIHMVLR